MKTRFALVCLGLAANALAADAPAVLALQVQPLAPAVPLRTANGAAKPATLHRVPAASVSETSVVRRADGSLVMNCVQKPNPKLAQQVSAQQSAAHSVEPQQP
jgi:hypothetical protein